MPRHNFRAFGFCSRLVRVKATFNIAVIGILTGSFFLASCHKRVSAPDTGANCITRLSPKVTDFEVSGADLDSIYSLFRANNLSTTNLQFQRWLPFKTPGIPPGTDSVYHEQVLARQFVNGLPVFTDLVAFNFTAGILPGAGSPGGYGAITGDYTGVMPSSDVSGNQSLSALRSAFLAHLSEASLTRGSVIDTTFIPSDSTFENVCLDVTLGYLDANSVPGSNIAPGKALVKVWSIVPAPDPSITYYPLVYVQDDNGVAWGIPVFLY